MKPENFSEAKFYNINYHPERDAYLKRHPEFKQFEFPQYYYFRILYDRMGIHWAIIKKEDEKFVIYFIDAKGQAFDKLEYKSIKLARRALKRNKFCFSTNKKCPYLPVNPIYVKLCCGRKSAPYSHPLGRLWDYEKKLQKANKNKIQYVNYGESEQYNYLLICIIIVISLLILCLFPLLIR